MFCLEIDLPLLLANVLFDLHSPPGESKGFQLAMGRTSMVCSALSALSPQEISHVNWSNPGGLSATWDCSLIKSYWLKAGAFRLEVKHTFERRYRLTTGKMSQEKTREFSVSEGQVHLWKVF